MITRGFDKPLYVLPFDHRGSFDDEDVRGEGHAPRKYGVLCRSIRTTPWAGIHVPFNSKNLR